MGLFACDRCGWITPTSELPYVCQSDGCAQAVAEAWFYDDRERADAYAREAGLVERGAVRFRGIWSSELAGGKADRTMPLRFRKSESALWSALFARNRSECERCKTDTRVRCCPTCWGIARPELVELDPDSPAVIAVVGFKGAGKTNLVQGMRWLTRRDFTTVGCSAEAERAYASMYGGASGAGTTIQLPQPTTEMPPPWTIAATRRGLVSVVFDMPGEQIQELQRRLREGEPLREQDLMVQQALTRANRLAVLVPFDATHDELDLLAPTLTSLGAWKQMQSGRRFERVATCLVKIDRVFPDASGRDPGRRARQDLAGEFFWNQARQVYEQAKHASTGQSTEAAVFGVSALGKAPGPTGLQVEAPLQPWGADEPLSWLIDPEQGDLGRVLEG